VIDRRLPLTVVPAASQLAVERVHHVGVDGTHLDATDGGDDVFVALSAVVLRRLEPEFGVGQVPLEELLDSRVRPGVTPLLDLQPEGSQQGLGLLLSVRSRRDRLT
jgi:hypothetical protein